MGGFPELVQLYPWTKALHLISVIAWMAGMFYLPRLYVYHSDAAPGSPMSETFKVMERRLLRGIINPAMIATWIFGLALVMTPGVVDWGAGWWHAKMFGFLAMSALHGYLAVERKRFAADERRHSAAFWRVVNEVPTLLLVLIVIMVIVKPF
ncbi:protoporphyrinogen oxidase HemJ [Roseomonas gilardii subsp. gilardii]|uniref:protoporphyrinogen oxidase HemJ n=1 Tax=Roseomonas gilardii TaxID=257708 RepID=UPI001FFB21B9|nr:protoporphyrinogen oxidase HemJ [Roseomonas gilardii]UPG73154.1 protoporphyrinogen oxidase HemJ [Roseomonas gilardii subsp. gilardii]